MFVLVHEIDVSQTLFNKEKEGNILIQNELDIKDNGSLHIIQTSWHENLENELTI